MNLIGKELRGIRIERKIGAGSMGTVYSGKVLKVRRGPPSGSRVSVKVLHPHLSDDPAAVTRFKREAGLGLTLRHPHIVKNYQVGSEQLGDSQVHYLVQEYIEGSTLKTLIKEPFLMSDHFLRRIALQIADALAFIHGKEIIHRDLKPENVFFESQGRVKVMDFGFSHKEQALKSRGSSEGFLGTVSYAAPERFGPDPVLASSDLYSFGVILYELATGENPFLGEDVTTTIAGHMYNRPPEPREKNRSISSFMSLFITALLEKDPARRLGPSSRVLRILKKGVSSRWWKSVSTTAHPDGLSPRRQKIHVVRRTGVFGRKRETARLLEMFEQVESGQGCRSACLSGEAGSGKTRLVDRLLEQLDRMEKPGRLVMVEGAQGSVKVPYLPLIAALRSFFGLTGLDRRNLRDALQERLAELFPGESDEEAKHFARFLISVDPETGNAIEEHGSELPVLRFSEIFAAIARETPLIVVVENALIADPPTFRVLTGMLSYLRDSSVFFLFTLRPEETIQDEQNRPHDLEKLLESTAPSGGRNIIPLKRLPRSDITRILLALGFPEKAAGGPFGERVFSVTEGNPYLVLEIAKLVEIEGRVQQSDVDWHGMLQEIPSSVRDIFYRRFFRISSVEREILEFASVIGRRFKIEEVVDGLELNFEQAARAVSRLQNRFALIRQVGRFYRFDHILIRDLLYDRIDPEVRARFHRIIGEQSASITGKRSLTGRDCYKAAMHFFHGRDSQRGLLYFQRAFDYLRFKQFHDRAYQLALFAADHVEHLDRSGEAPDPSFCCDLYLKQAEVSGFLGQRKVQFKALKAALDAVRKSEATSLMALVRLRIGQYYHSTSMYISALSTLEGALAWMRRIEDLRGEADTLEALSAVLQDVGDKNRAFASLRSALELRDRLEDRTGRAGVLVKMADYYLARSKPVAAKEALDKARKIYKSLNNKQGLAPVLMGLGKIEKGRGNLQSAEKALKEAGRIAREVGDAALESEVFTALGECQEKRGRLADALACYQESLQIARAIRNVALQVRLLTTQAGLLVHADNPDPDTETALAKARQALALSRKALLHIRDRIGSLEVLASVFLRMNRPLSAYAIYRKILRTLKEEGGPQELVGPVRLKFDKIAKRLGKAQ